MRRRKTAIINDRSGFGGCAITGNGVFVGPGVMFANDLLPRAINLDGSLKSDSDWEVLETRVGIGAAIGMGSIVGPGRKIGEYALIGMGSLVTRDVEAYNLVLEHENGTKFVLQTEIEDNNRVHHIILFPEFSKVEEVREAFKKNCKNLDTEGRPKIWLNGEQICLYRFLL